MSPVRVGAVLLIFFVAAVSMLTWLTAGGKYDQKALEDRLVRVSLSALRSEPVKLGDLYDLRSAIVSLPFQETLVKAGVSQEDIRRLSLGEVIVQIKRE